MRFATIRARGAPGRHAGWALALLLSSCGNDVGVGPSADAGVMDAPAVSDVAARDVSWDAPRVTLERYPKIDGSTSTLPLARVIACELLGVGYRWEQGIGSEGEAGIVPVAETPAQEPLAAQIAQRIVHSRTHQAYLNLVDGTADVILVANPPSPDELAYARSRGVTLVERSIALDALVMIVHATNPVAGLSAEQIRGVFSARITRWREVGGGDGEIHPYVRPENSGSQPEPSPHFSTGFSVCLRAWWPVMLRSRKTISCDVPHFTAGNEGMAQGASSS